MNLDKLSIDIESTKMVRKLRAIAKHSNELADELEAIENEWQCDCGSLTYYDQKPTWTDNPNIIVRCCTNCKHIYVTSKESKDDTDLPIRLEGSE